MTSPDVLPKGYTHEPEQHPKLILGSLQLLLWLVFRPKAWINHLRHIDPALVTNYFFSKPISRLQSRNLALRRLLIQAYLVLPILANLAISLVLWVLGESVENITVSLAFGLTLGLGLSVVYRVTYGMALSVAWGVGSGVVSVLALEFASVVATHLAPVLAWVLALGVVLGVVSGVVSGVALIKKSGFLSGLKGMVLNVVGSVIVILYCSVGGVICAVGLVLITINLLRPIVLYPLLAIWNTLLYLLDKIRTDTQPSLLRWHTAFWDEWQWIPLYGLDKHLLLVIERNFFEGRAAINYLIFSPQRWAVQAAQIELDARGLERCTNVEAIRKARHRRTSGELESPVNTLLRIFSRISEDVEAALNQGSTYNQRLALRAITDFLDACLPDFYRSRDKYVPRFYPIAKSWHQIITDYVDELAKATELRQEIDNPYIIGIPITQEQKIFTGRNDIGTRIEQLLLDRRRPPLLLYGQRRMGKTSLLNNLGRLLPNTIIPMFVDLQGAPSSARDYAGFLYNIARRMIDSAMRQRNLTLPPLTQEMLATDPFTCFDQWLDEVEVALEQKTALLALDEFEVLDRAITKGRFDEEDVLGMLRNLIQHRPRFKVLLAGSHTIEEYQRWASYLINVQVVHISYLQEAEARQLIEFPTTDFTLRYEANAVERVLQLTRCHPFLVQLLCGEIVALKNEQDPSVRRLATLADVEAAIPEALSSGSFFFADINNQVDAAGLAILRFIAAQGEGAVVSRQVLSHQFSDHLNNAIAALLQRELFEEADDGYRFQVELIRRWFAIPPR